MSLISWNLITPALIPPNTYHRLLLINTTVCWTMFWSFNLVLPLHCTGHLILSILNALLFTSDNLVQK